ncbi:hypothetical protein BDZ97DRAFT_1870893 [Flammula alnicola]|nr:hypothetical protein BDZ97DRAFT_1870893 [Flammula alnicola]
MLALPAASRSRRAGVLVQTWCILNTRFAPLTIAAPRIHRIHPRTLPAIHLSSTSRPCTSRAAQTKPCLAVLIDLVVYSLSSRSYNARAVSTHAPPNAYTHEILTLSVAAFAATPSFLPLLSPATATVRMLAWAPTATTRDGVCDIGRGEGAKAEGCAFELSAFHVSLGRLAQRVASLAAPILLALSLLHPFRFAQTASRHVSSFWGVSMHIRVYRRWDSVLWGRYVVVLSLVVVAGTDSALVGAILLRVGRRRHVV